MRITTLFRSQYSTHVWRRARPFVPLAALALMVLCATVGIGALELVSSFEQVEAAVTEQQSLLVYHAFQADLLQLATSNRDYAEWDDAVNFVTTHDSRFLSTNFVPDALGVMRVDLAWIVDPDGQVLYSGMAQRDAAKIISPAPLDYERQLRRFITERRLAPTLEFAHTSHGLAEVSVLEIKRTDRSQPTGARMVFARLIEASDLMKLRDATQLRVSLVDLNDQSVAALLPKVRAWISSPPAGKHTFVHATDSSSIEGYALVRDGAQHPLALLVTHTSRDIYGLGYRRTWLILVTVVGLHVVFGTAVLWLTIRLRRSFAARQAAELRYRNIASQIRDPIALIDADSLRFIDANDAVLHALDCDRAELPTRAVKDLFAALGPEILSGVGRSPGSRIVIESRTRVEGGRWTDCEVALAYLSVEGLGFITAVGHDISHRREAQECERVNQRRLIEVAERDALTGLPNRLYLDARLPRLLETIAGGASLALLYVDIDQFKNINSSYGHGCGDRLLQAIAKRISASLSAQDRVARTGGDEFVIVAPFRRDRLQVDELARQLQRSISAPIVVEQGTITVTASIGIVLFDGDGTDAKTLIKRADIALYQAKDAGRNCHRFFSPEMGIGVSEHVMLEQALRHAIGTEQIFMFFQPIVDLRDQTLISFEALMRWQQPERGMVPPGKFIPVAEKTGLISDLGRQGLELVVSQIREWQRAGLSLVPIAVNVSPVQFERIDFPALVSTLCREAEVDSRWLKFEITESALMREPAKLAGMLQALRSLGSEVLIDDFGTGYSSLSYLMRLPVDTLKIDRAFIQGLGKGPAQPLILDAVIGMARRLGLRTIAEGVETEEQVIVLRALGCDFAQGYYFGEPVSPLQCRLLLSRIGPRARLSNKPLTAVG